MKRPEGSDRSLDRAKRLLRGCSLVLLVSALSGCGLSFGVDLPSSRGEDAAPTGDGDGDGSVGSGGSDIPASTGGASGDAGSGGQSAGVGGSAWMIGCADAAWGGAAGATVSEVSCSP